MSRGASVRVSENLRRFGIIGFIGMERPTPVLITMEGRAALAVDKAMKRDGFTLRSVRCFRALDGQSFCAVCADHPERLLGATLVRCTQDACEWPLDVSEWQHLDWNGEDECARRTP